jgi:photosystem II stability/assembly factor-like uncharacterized protein
MNRRRLVVMVGTLVLGWSLIVGSLAAQEPEPAPGELMLPNDPELTLTGVIAPSSGALFVTGQDASAGLKLLRSDDAGANWRPVSLPPPAEQTQPQALAIDPTNHTTLYATGFGGLYKSDDDAASWRPVLAIAEPNVTIAVSPADRQLVYLALRSEKTVRIVRSEDGGATWQPAYTYTSAETACTKPVLLVPHPTDASRLFANVECDWRVAGDLYQSRDRGETWELLLAQGSNNFNGSVIAVVGGTGEMPTRLYAAFTGHYSKHRGFSLDVPVYRSDDDGQTWSIGVIVPLTVSGPKSQERNGALLKTVVGDPSMPDRVYAGLKNAQSERSQPLQWSNDGGRTWKPLDIGEAKDVLAAVLGVDRQHLYAVTERGLYRLRLP